MILPFYSIPLSRALDGACGGWYNGMMRLFLVLLALGTFVALVYRSPVPASQVGIAGADRLSASAAATLDGE